jgi:N-acetylglucosamine-6-phosphate deacetylase
MVTLAPERDGVLAAIERIADVGVVAAVGHTEATYEKTRAAIAPGATVATHLFNAIRFCISYLTPQAAERCNSSDLPASGAALG